MKKERTERSAFFWDLTAFSCFGFSFVAGVAGSLLTTTWVLNGQLHPWLRALGFTLLIGAIPILLLGGHCLDLADRRQKESGRKDVRPGMGPLHVVALIAFFPLLFISS